MSSTATLVVVVLLAYWGVAVRRTDYAVGDAGVCCRNVGTICRASPVYNAAKKIGPEISGPTNTKTKLDLTKLFGCYLTTTFVFTLQIYVKYSYRPNIFGVFCYKSGKKAHFP